MRIMERRNGHYELAAEHPPLASDQPLINQILAARDFHAAAQQQAKCVRPFALVFTAAEQAAVIARLAGVQTDKPPKKPLPAGFPPGDEPEDPDSLHPSGPVRKLLDWLLMPSGLVSELFPPEGEPEASLKDCLLGIVKLQQA